MTTSKGFRAVLGIALAGALFGSGVAVASALGSHDPVDEGRSRLPGFSRVISLSHIADPATTPLFPGDPTFTIRTAFTIDEDGFYLEVVHEGQHTGTHYSAPCHFHTGRRCMDELSPADLVLPAVVIDVESEVANDPDFIVRVDDLKAWEAEHGDLPQEAAVLLLTGCDRYWADGDVDGEPTYYNCGSGESGFHQPGFSRNAVKWLIDQGVLGRRGALGSDTFGPDPSSDARYMPTTLTLARRRVTIENLTNLDRLPATGAWIVLGSPRNVHGSGAPGTVFAFVP
jgi:kynurenine formamidase